LCASLGDERAGFHEIFEELLDVLVVDVELVFESVQFGVIVDFPPFAVEHGVLRLRDLPLAGRRILGRQFFVRGRRRLNGGGGLMVFGADHAAGEQNGRE